MGNTRSNKKMGGWGLVEILISMTIYAIAIITITSLNLKNYYIIRQNELSDRANKVMIGAIEYFKSPAKEVQDSLASALSTKGSTAYFVLNSGSKVIDVSNPTAIGWEVTTNTASATSCSTSSVANFKFKLNSTTVADNFLGCIYVRVTRESIGYSIQAVLTFQKDSTSKLINSDLIGFRPFTYEDED